MALVILRCRIDRDLCNVLLIMGLACVSLAVPFHFEKQAISVVWAVEAIMLVVIGLRYRNTLVQAAAGAVLALAIGRLAWDCLCTRDRSSRSGTRPSAPGASSRRL